MMVLNTGGAALKHSDHTWALILGAGDGRRLSDLTGSATGRAVPKQFCSLRGGSSLLQETIERAGGLASRDHISVILSETHRRWWQDAGLDLPAENIVVQPANRGTAIGILLQLLCVLERDPAAEVVLLPSDHHVADEGILQAALRRALELVRRAPERVVLLGMTPEGPDPELGYMVPGAPDDSGAPAVREFVEKPSPRRARDLIAQGALWSPFILVARGQTLLARIEECLPAIVQALRDARRARGGSGADLARLYERLPTLDFSHHVLTISPGAALSVVAVPACGWSDLGTPERLGQTLSRLTPQPPDVPDRAPDAHVPVNLAARYYARHESGACGRTSHPG